MRSRRARLLYEPLDPRVPPRLDQAMRSDEALQVLGRYQMAKLMGAQSGVVHDLHPEHLHDFRVALRRTRTLLGQMRSVVVPDTYQHFREELKWLADGTSATRDLDVLLERLPDYQPWVSPELAGGVEALEAQISCLRDSSHDGVVRTLDNPRCRQLMRDWQGFLAAQLPYTPLTKDGGTNVRETALRVVTLQVRRVFRLAGKVRRKSSPKQLHRLRIEAKKLRYLFEFFGSLFPATPIGRRIERLKLMQDGLGELNDYAVHRDLLLRLARDPVAARQPLGLVATGELSRSLTLHARKGVKAFAAEARRFTRTRNRKRFLRLR